MEEQYIIISGTNRKDSNTIRLARVYQNILQEKNINAKILSLEELDLSHRSEAFKQLELELLLPSQKFVFIAPEYNASIPGVLKTLLDLSDYQRTWTGKKALLVGLSTGRSGNVRGLEHLTSILNYMKVVVMPNKLPVSSIHQLFNGPDDVIADPGTLKAIHQQIDEFIKF